MKHLAITILAITLISIAGAAANSLISTDQILVWSDFDGTGTNLLDERGRQNGTINGTLVRNTTDKPSGLPYSLTGSFSLANHAYWTSNPAVQDVRMNENKTIVIWFRNVTGTNRGMSGDFASPSSSGYFYSDAGGLMTVYLLNATANPSVSSTVTNAQAGGWNMYGLQYNTTHLSMYLNGSSVGTPTSARGNYLNTAPRRIGYTDESAVNAPVTGVAQFIVINATLSTTQWTCLYNSGAGRTYSSFVTNCLATNLTITASDAYNGTSIQTFNASITWNGTTTTYTTTTGTITTNITPVNATFPANVTLTANNYFANTTTTNSTTLAATMAPWTLIRAIAFNGTVISNFSVNYTNYANTSDFGSTSTTNGAAYIPLFNASYNVTVFNAQQGAINYARESRNVTANPYDQAENFTLFLTNSVFVTFINENTGAVINTTTISAFFTGTLASYNYTTTNGYLNATLLNPQNYTITYSANGFDQREYFLELSNQTYQSLTLYLLDNSNTTLVLVTIVDTASAKVEDAVVYLNKKNLTGTNYYTVEMCTTDANGECLLNPQLYTTTYNILVSYEGTTSYESGDAKISSTSLLFVINRGEEVLENYFEIANIEGSLTTTKYNNDTEVGWSATYTNPSLSGQAFMLQINGINNGVRTQIYAVNGTGASGTLTYNTTITTIYDSMEARLFYYNNDGTPVLLESQSINTGSFELRMGRFGLFMFGFFFVGIVAFAALSSGLMAFMFSIPTVFTFLQIIGIGAIGWEGVMLLWAITITIWAVIRRKQ